MSLKFQCLWLTPNHTQNFAFTDRLTLIESNENIIIPVPLDKTIPVADQSTRCLPGVGVGTLHCSTLYVRDFLHLSSSIFLLFFFTAVLLEKLTGPQPVKTLPAFCGNRRFITAFSRFRHLSVSRARLVQSTPPYPTS
jgi:hypothetical protein